MKIRRGDLVEVTLDGAEGAEIRKKRPAIILQNDTGNQYSPVTIIAPCSSGSHKNYPTEVLLPEESEPVDKDTLVKCNQIRTVDVDRRIVRKFGQISKSKMREIDKATRISLGL